MKYSHLVQLNEVFTIVSSNGVYLPSPAEEQLARGVKLECQVIGHVLDVGIAIHIKGIRKTECVLLDSDNSVTIRKGPLNTEIVGL